MAIRYGITFHPKWWHKNAGIDFSQPFFDDPAYRIDCDLKMRKCLYEHFGDLGVGEENPLERPLIGTDLLAAGYLNSEIFGCRIVYESDNSPQVICRELDGEEAGKIKAPDLDSDPVWERTQKQIDWLLEKYGRVETYTNLMGIQNVAMDIMGQELFTAYYTDELGVRSLLNEVYILSKDIGKRFRALSRDVSGGVTAIIRDVLPDCYLGSNCSVEMVSNDLYEGFLLEYDQKLAEDFGTYGIHHCGQTMEHVIRGYSKVKDLRFAEVGAGSDVAEIRRVLPDALINARYSPAKLMNETAVEIHENVKNLYNAGKTDDGRQMLSISCVGIDHNVTDENIREFLIACREL